MFLKSKTLMAMLGAAGLLAACQTDNARTSGSMAQYMDRQEVALRAELARTGVGVTRDGDNLVLNIENDILFDRNSAAVKPQAKRIIHSVAVVLKRFRATLVNVDGFTDTTGTRDYNLKLSTVRADAVADELAGAGVAAKRLSTRGYGENYLKVRTADGAAEPRNRRVEITLEPDLG